ncbi:MAG: Riboflavin transporter RibZ, partial [Pseudomonadota bacterium]
LLISHLGWRSIFWVNIPVAILGLYLAAKNIESTRHSVSSFRFDWLGALLQAVALTLLLFSVDPPMTPWIRRLLEQHPGLSWYTISVAALFFLAFLWVEARARFPLLDLNLLRIRAFWMPNLAGFLTFVAYSTVSVLTPFFLEDAMGFAPSRAGLFMTAIPLTIFVVAPVSGWLSDRIGSVWLSVAGGVVGVLSLLANGGLLGAGILADSSALRLILGLGSVGVATGLFQSPNNSAIMNAVPPEKLSLASALLATFRNLGLVIGTGVSTAVFSWRLGTAGDLTEAYHFTLLIAAGVALFAVLVSFARRQTPG